MTTSFNKEKHEYLIDGKKATGVTTIIGVLAKPALIGWAAKMAVECIREHISEQKLSDFETWDELCEEARTAHTKKKDDAASHGTNAHELVEEYINYLSDISGGSPLSEIKAEGVPDFTPIQKFIDWAVENVDHFIFSERQMYNKEMFIAGTADFACVLKTGQKLIGDFKTSSGIYGIDYYIQCAGYKILAEAEGDEKYDGCVIVRLGKKGQKDFDVTYNYDTTTAEKSFMACLTLYRAQTALKETAVRD